MLEALRALWDLPLNNPVLWAELTQMAPSEDPTESTDPGVEPEPPFSLSDANEGEDDVDIPVNQLVSHILGQTDKNLHENEAGGLARNADVEAIQVDELLVEEVEGLVGRGHRIKKVSKWYGDEWEAH